MLSLLTLSGQAAGQANNQEVAAALKKAVDPAVAKLTSPELATRQAAIRELGRLGPVAASASGPLVRAMKEKAVRPSAIETLGRIGPGAAGELIAALEDSDPHFRAAALEALARFELAGPAPAGLAEKLAAQVGGEKPPELRLAALRAVARLAVGSQGRREEQRTLAPALSQGERGNFGATASGLAAVLVDSLEHPAESTQGATADALAALGPEAVPAVLRGLQDKRMAVRVGSAEAIRVMGPRMPGVADATPILIAWLNQDAWRLRLAAARALGNLDQLAEPAVPRLIEIAWKQPAPKPDSSAQGLDVAGPVWAFEAAQRALIRLGPRSASAAPLLLDSLSDVRSPRRVEAVETLGAIGPAAAKAKDRLLALLQEPRWNNPGVLVVALSRLGPEVAGPAAQLLSHPEPRLQEAGVEILRRMGPSGLSAGPALLAYLTQSKDTVARRSVLEAIAALGPGPAETAQVLAGMLTSEKDSDVQRQMFLTLAALGDIAVGPVAGLLGHSDAAIRREAVAALGWIGLPGAVAVRSLIERLGDEDAPVRLAAPLALGRIGTTAIEPLVSATHSRDEKTRAGAVEALGRIGPDASGADSAPRRLVALLRDEAPPVRASAAWALGQLGAKELDSESVRAGLDALLADPKEPAAVRSAAAASLAAGGSPTAALVERLAGMLADAATKDAAVDGLKAIGRKVYGAP